MPNKRSRAGSSSTLFASHASLPLLESNNIPSPAPPQPLIKQPYNPKKVVKQSSDATDGTTVDESRRRLGGVLSLSPPPVQYDGATATGRSGHVLEPAAAAATASDGGLSQRCFTCSKKFGQTMDLFMYRGLAFCNGVCRDEQIKIDSVREKKSE